MARNNIMPEIRAGTYEEAINHYQAQKEEFLKQLNQHRNIVQKQITDEIWNINEKLPDIENTANRIISNLETIMNKYQDNNLKYTRQELIKLYENKDMSKKEAIAEAKKFIKLLNQNNVFKNILTKLGSTQAHNYLQIDNSALLGRMKAIITTGYRHEAFNSEYVKSTLKGVLYELALVDGLKKYFSKVTGDNFIEVTPIGKQGGISDIKIEFPKNLNQQITGEATMDTFYMQVKNFDPSFLIDKSKPINVSSQKDLFNQFPYRKYQKTRRKYYSMVFFSENIRNIKQALGENNTIYGYNQGALKFTSDLIDYYFNSKKYALSFFSNSRQWEYVTWSSIAKAKAEFYKKKKKS